MNNIAHFLVFASCITSMHAQTITKLDNANDLNVGSSWSSGVTPISSNILRWESTVTSANTVDIGGNLTVEGLINEGPTGNVTINGTDTLFIGASGMEFGATATNLTINCPLDLNGNQEWRIAAGKEVVINGNISGTGVLSKNWSGSLTLSGNNTFTSDITFTTRTSANVGSIILTSSSALGVGPKSFYTPANGNSTLKIELEGSITITDVALHLTGRQYTGDYYLSLTNNSGNNTWDGDVYIASTGGSYGIESKAGKLTIAGSMTSNVGGNRSFEFVGAGDFEVTGNFSDGSGVVGIRKDGTGTLTISGANTNTRETVLFGGVLEISAAERMTDSGKLRLSGGTFSTGSTVGFSETMGTLDLQANSTINFGAGDHVLTFAASNAETWFANTITITNWSDVSKYDGTAAGAGHPKLFVGNSSGDLTASQLAKIFFINPSDGQTYLAEQLASGEVVPSGTILPVELAYFTFQFVANNFVQLKWRTLSEIGTKSFIIYRSEDGVNFEKISEIPSGGNAFSSTDYSFIDVESNDYGRYYQLRELTSNNVESSLSTLALNEVINSSSNLELFVSFENELPKVLLKSRSREEALLNVYTTNGERLYSKKIQLATGDNVCYLPTVYLKKGYYVFSVVSKTEKTAIVTKKP